MGNPFAVRGYGGPDASSHRLRGLAHELGDRGYSTAHVGKWGVDWPEPVSTSGKGLFRCADASCGGAGPIERGFDRFYGLWGHGHDHWSKACPNTPGIIDWHNWTKTGAGTVMDDDVDPRPTVHSTDALTDEGALQ